MASLAALVPGYLKTDPSDRWSFTAGNPPTITGIGDCAAAVVTTT